MGQRRVLDPLNRALQKGGRRTRDQKVQEEDQGGRRGVNHPFLIPSSLSPPISLAEAAGDTSRRPRFVENGVIDDTMGILACAGLAELALSTCTCTCNWAFLMIMVMEMKE